MRRLVPMLACLLLGACATQPTPKRMLTPEAAQGLSIVDLCLIVGYAGPISSSNAASELHNRGVDCRDYAPQIQARLQAGLDADQQRRALAAGMVLQGMQNMQQPTIQVPTYQIPQPINCTTQRFGNTLQSVCR